MFIPVRCFSCNKTIANKWCQYEKLLKEGQSAEDALTSLKIKRYCCRRMFLGHVDLYEKLKHYKKNNETTFDENLKK